MISRKDERVQHAIGLIARELASQPLAAEVLVVALLEVAGMAAARVNLSVEEMKHVLQQAFIDNVGKKAPLVKRNVFEPEDSKA